MENIECPHCKQTDGFEQTIEYVAFNNFARPVRCKKCKKFVGFTTDVEKLLEEFKKIIYRTHP